MYKTKVGVLYICTGKYAVFWNDFYKSSQQFFLQEEDVEKHYFVFTDCSEIKASSDVHIYFKESEGFPADSLGRFDMFLSIEQDLNDMDFVFFFNSNMFFLEHVGKEILPINNLSGLAGLQHPGYYNSGRDKFPYERDPRSTAFMSYVKNADYKYFMGALNGGRIQEFLSLCRTCSFNIRQDAKQGIVACFHDESHINAYFFQKDVLVLPPMYGFPEGLSAPFIVKILIRDKTKHDGDYFVKEYANPFLLPSPFKNHNVIKKLWFKWIRLIKEKWNR